MTKRPGCAAAADSGALEEVRDIVITRVSAEHEGGVRTETCNEHDVIRQKVLRVLA